MCKGYTITFSACKHVGRVVEHRCADAARLRSDHCDILVTSRETDRHQQGSCTDCLTRINTGSGLKEIRSASEVSSDERTKSSPGSASPPMSPTPPSRRRTGGRGRPTRMREQHDRKLDDNGGEGSSSTAHAQAQVVAETDESHGEVRIALARDIEISYRNLVLNRDKRPKEEYPESEGEPCSEDDESSACSQASSADGDSAEFGSWLRSKSVVEAGRRRE